MTAPTTPLAVVYEAPAVPSQGYGLYAAATLLDSGATPRELLAGIDIFPFNCDTGVGSYVPDICDTTPPEKAPGARPDLLHFDPLVVWAAAECAPDQTEAEELARARQIRTLHEPLIVESAFATTLLADAGAAAAATSLMDAIGQLEVFLGEQGYAGYLHASRKWAVEAGFLNAASGSAVLRTNMGNTWVFGGGYDSALGNTIIATGPITVWRSTPFEEVVTTGSHVTPAYNNTVYALSERVVTVGYECAVHAVEITIP
jgi:hypothetical protein